MGLIPSDHSHMTWRWEEREEGGGSWEAAVDSDARGGEEEVWDILSNGVATAAD